MNRRNVLTLTLGAVLTTHLAQGQTLLPEVPEPVEEHPLAAAWDAWKAAYMEPGGRIVDRLQQGASHSESQGYGLLLAAEMRDAEAFDRIDGWTMAHLRIRPDSLLAWRWLPTGSQPVPDLNNASDGDLFYAWALVRGAAALARPELLGRARVIATDLAATCVLPHPGGGGRLLLVPAATGFERETGLIVNPSYLMPLAMREVARETGVERLAICAADGEMLLADLAQVGLLPDWIEVQLDGFAPAQDLSEDNGYEAMRAPLFLVWSGRSDHLAVRRQAEAYSSASTEGGQTPTIMERETGRVLETSADPGYAALAGLADCVVRTWPGADIPRFSTDQPYYPATLHLMALLAQREVATRCVPI